jgi:hypothetical protein
MYQWIQYLFETTKLEYLNLHAAYKSVFQTKAIYKQLNCLFLMQIVYSAQILQLVMRSLATRQVIHGHNLNHQARPPREMLVALSSARLWVILLPCKARLLPALENCVDKILAQLRVQLAGFLAVRAALGCKVL